MLLLVGALEETTHVSDKAPRMTNTAAASDGDGVKVTHAEPECSILDL